MMSISLRAWLPDTTGSKGIEVNSSPNGTIRLELKSSDNIIEVRADDLVRLLRHLELDVEASKQAIETNPFLAWRHWSIEDR